MVRGRLIRHFKKRGGAYVGAMAAGRAARAGYNMFRGGGFGAMATGARRGIASAVSGNAGSSGVTTQHDRTRQYRRKRRRPNKRWKKFVKKVRAVTNIDLGAQTRVFNDSENSINNIVGLNGVFEQHLYPCGTIYDDMQLMMTELNTGNPTSAAGITVAESTKIRFRTAILDMTLRNTSFVTQTGALDPGLGLEIDIYEIIMPTPALDLTTTTQSLVTSISSSMLEQKRIGGAGTSVWATALNAPNRGSTPFEYSRWLSEHKVKILKKTKYFLGGGGTLTYQIKDKKDRYTTKGAIQDQAGFTFKNWTRSLLIYFKAVPGFIVGTGVGEVSERINVGTTRKYLYTYEGQNESKDRFN